ncbi:presenilin At2g29900, partial [Olea europaea subsp. europaea]
MDQNQKPRTILETLGEELIRIITPVSICMLLVVILVKVLNTDSEGSSIGLSFTTIATVAYSESSSDSIWDKLKGALLNSLVFIAVIAIVTFLLVLLFYFRCTKFLKYYMGFSSFLVLGFMGGEITVFLLKDFSFPVDCITFVIVLFNFTVVGVLAVFMSKMAIFVTQAYLVVIGMLVAYWFTLLPEWTTWVLLIAMALYDLAAVLLPGGPLRLLVELAISRDEDIPALVYEARPVINNDSSPSGDVVQRRVWRERRNAGSTSDENSDARPNTNTTHDTNLNTTLGTNLSAGNGENEIDLVNAEEDDLEISEQPASPPESEEKRSIVTHAVQSILISSLSNLLTEFISWLLSLAGIRKHWGSVCSAIGSSIPTASELDLYQTAVATDLHVSATLRPTEAELGRPYISTLLPFEDRTVLALDDVARDIIPSQLRPEPLASGGNVENSRGECALVSSGGGSEDDDESGNSDDEGVGEEIGGDKSGDSNGEALDEGDSEDEHTCTPHTGTYSTPPMHRRTSCLPSSPQLPLEVLHLRLRRQTSPQFSLHDGNGGETDPVSKCAEPQVHGRGFSPLPVDHDEDMDKEMQERNNTCGAGMVSEPALNGDDDDVASSGSGK